MSDNSTTPDTLTEEPEASLSKTEQREMGTARRLSNLVPPYKPGVSGNKGQRNTAGAIITNHLNRMGRQGYSAKKLRKIQRNQGQPQLKRAAAERLLRMVDGVSLLDFEKYIDGKCTLEELREEGVNVDVIKKVKARIRRYDMDGKPVEEIIREIELFDRAGEETDRVQDRTEGRPAQAVNVTGTIQITEIMFVIPGMMPVDN